MTKYFLISGASSGIGRALAEDLALQGHHVFATAPTEVELQSLVGISERILPFLLDIRSEEHIVQLKESVLQHTNCLDGLINNAGIGLGGPVELLDVDGIRDSFNINVFGHITMTQTFLPLIRMSKQGRIVFTGSSAGLFVLPLTSAYSASKFALRAFCDALRVELKPSSIRVSLIQPGSIQTPIWSKGPFDEVEKHPGIERYHAALVNGKNMIAQGAKNAIPVNRVTKVMNHALFSKYPRARYVVGLDGWVAFLARFVPAILMDRILGKLLS